MGYGGTIAGVHNLRGTVVPIIDMRQEYQLEPFANPAESKILVVGDDEELYGLQVDGVDDILKMQGKKTIAMPRSLTRISKELHSDIQDCLEVSTDSGDKKLLLFYNVKNFISRLSVVTPELESLKDSGFENAAALLPAASGTLDAELGSAKIH